MKITRDYPFSKDSKNSFANLYYLTARRLDIETGLYYYRARIYNPYIGRSLQTDQIGYEDNMNLYAYVGNNPIVLIDPLGQLEWSPYPGTGYYVGKDYRSEIDWTAAKVDALNVVAFIDEGMHSIEGFFNMLEYKATSSIYNGIQQASHLSSLGPVTVYIPRFGQYEVDFGFVGTLAGAIDSVVGDELQSHAENAYDRWQWHKYQKWEYGQMQWNGLLSPITRKQQNTNVTSGSSFLSNPNVPTFWLQS